MVFFVFILGYNNDMWIPHFGYALWDKGDSDLIKSDASKKDTSKREFEVIFTLEDPDRRKKFDSPFVLKENETKTQTEIKGDKKEEITMLFEKNEEERLGRIRFKIKSNSSIEALVRTYNNLSNLISFITFASASPLSIFGVVVVDLKHQTAREAFPQYAAPEEFALPAGLEFDDKFKAILSLYREGRNSPSPFYRFFCFYKILEGFYERREAFRDADEYIKKYPEIKRPQKKIDQDTLVWAIAYPKYKELDGKAFGYFYKWITQSHRHLIAHIFPEKYPQDKWLNLDDFKIHTEFAIIGNITDLVVRQLLSDELELWNKIRNKIQ
ncbi:MAG: methylamine utilization protein MauJ [Candidatus Moranbacteria bacterium]|nr:methylamine utilization protein MauJ [Candidatus Moranbacteria bacterium]